MTKPDIFKYEIQSSISSINQQHWDSVVRDRNIYLSIPYLSSLAETMANKMDFIYVLVYNKEEEPVMVAIFQRVTLMYKKRNHSSSLLKYFSCDKTRKNTLDMLVCGNVFADGENGFLWSNSISSTKAIEHIAEITKQVKTRFNSKKRAPVLLFKEFWPQSLPHINTLKHYKFRDFKIDVNMVLPIHPSWQSIDDYVDCLKAKFRTKYNSVHKKSGELVLKSFAHHDIINHQDRIKELFDNVVEKSDFSFGIISPLSFSAFKEKLGESFLFRGIFLNEKLVGFSTSFFHKGIMEANYVGLDYTYNVEKAVYQRLLYDYLEQAITHKVAELQFGRTSELLKSSLGALPVDMTLYAKHNSVIPNLLAKSISRFISPSEFELRKPFKTKFLQEWAR